MVDKDDKAYFNSWANTILAQSHQVRNLIGDAHWLSDGHHKEYLVKEVIEKYIPRSAVVATGFMKPQRPDIACSKELDVFVYDTVSDTPYFHENGLAIVSPSSVIGHIEIKSTFNKSFLKDAVLNTMSAKSLSLRFSHTKNLWSSICVFHVPESRSLKSVAKTICEAVKEVVFVSKEKDLYIINAAQERDVLPTCIFSLSGFIAFVRLDDAMTSLQVDVFESGGLSSALAFSDLFSRIRARFGGASSDDLNTLLLDVCGTDTYKESYSVDI